jgi:hypothetical protein
MRLCASPLGLHVAWTARGCNRIRDAKVLDGDGVEANPAGGAKGEEGEGPFARARCYWQLLRNCRDVTASAAPAEAPRRNSSKRVPCGILPL